MQRFPTHRNLLRGQSSESWRVCGEVLVSKGYHTAATHTRKTFWRDDAIREIRSAWDGCARRAGWGNGKGRPPVGNGTPIHSRILRSPGRRTRGGTRWPATHRIYGNWSRHNVPGLFTMGLYSFHFAGACPSALDPSVVRARRRTK